MKIKGTFADYLRRSRRRAQRELQIAEQNRENTAVQVSPISDQNAILIKVEQTVSFS